MCRLKPYFQWANYRALRRNKNTPDNPGSHFNDMNIHCTLNCSMTLLETFNLQIDMLICSKNYMYLNIYTTNILMYTIPAISVTKVDRLTQDGYSSMIYYIHWEVWYNPWWRHQRETFFALLAICAGNSPVPGEVPTYRPMTQSFDVFFDLRPNKRLSRQWRGWWFETPPCPLWRLCNASASRNLQPSEMIRAIPCTYDEACRDQSPCLGYRRVWLVKRDSIGGEDRPFRQPWNTDPSQTTRYWFSST